MKIGSPKNLEGKNLLVGVSAVDSNGNAIGSDITTLKKGANVTFTSSANGVLVIAAESVASVENATSAVYAINDKNGNDIATTYQTVISDGNKLSGAYISGVVASATEAANVKDSVIKMQLNGVAVDSFTLNQGTSKVINYAGVAMTSDLTAYATTLDLTMDTTAYVVSAVLKNGTTVLTSKTIDLPLETMVVGADYDSANKNIKLTLKNGTVTSFSVSDLINGLVPDTRKVNGMALSDDVTLTALDIKMNGSANAITIESRISQLATSIGNAGTGDMKTTDYVDANGTGIVRSAVNATTVNGLTVSTEVPANAKFTDTIPGSATLTISVGGVSMGSFNANATTDSSINIPEATSTTYGVVKVEQVVSNTTNAVANKVVSSVSSTMNAHIESTSLHVPVFNATNNGQVLKISGGVAKWDTDLTADGSAVLPNYNATNAGQVLKVNATGNGTEWSVGATGNMNTVDYVMDGGTGVVLSAGNATTVNGHTVSANVPANAKFTDTIPGSGVLTISGVGSSLGTFEANASSNSTIAIPQATSESYGLVKVEKVVSNTDNAVANSVVSTVSASLLSAINEHVDTTNVHVPSTGTTGYYLKKTTNGNEWAAINIPTFDIDSEITSNGVNAVAGSAIYNMVEARAKIEDLSRVAFTGNYSDLIGTPNDSSINAHIINSAIHVPTGGTSGQVLKINANGVPAWNTDLTADGSAVLPTYGVGDANKILKVNNAGTSTSWETANVGDMTIASYVNGNGVVKSATHAASADSLVNAITINGVALNGGTTKTLDQLSIASATHTHTSGQITSFNTVVSDIASTVASAQIANKVNDATITFMQGGVAKGSFTLNQSINSTITLDVAGGGNITLDSAITSDGVNAVAGSAIYNGLASKVDAVDLAQVAFTGDYNDLVNKPSGTGGNIVVAGEVTATETNAVAGSAVYNYVSSQMGNISALLASL